MKPKLFFKINNNSNDKKVALNWIPSVSLQQRKNDENGNPIITTNKKGRKSSKFPENYQRNLNLQQSTSFIFPNQEKIRIEMTKLETQQQQQEGINSAPNNSDSNQEANHCPIKIQFRLCVPLSLKDQLMKQQGTGDLKRKQKNANNVSNSSSSSDDDENQDYEQDALELFFCKKKTNNKNQTTTTNASRDDDNDDNSSAYNSTSRFSKAHELFALKEWWKWASEENLNDLLNCRLCAENNFNLELHVDVTTTTITSGQPRRRLREKNDETDSSSSSSSSSSSDESSPSSSCSSDDDDATKVSSQNKKKKKTITSTTSTRSRSDEMKTHIVPLHCSSVHRNQNTMSTLAYFDGMLEINVATAPPATSTTTTSTSLATTTKISSSSIFISARVKTLIPHLDVKKTEIRRENAERQKIKNQNKKKKKNNKEKANGKKNDEDEDENSNSNDSDDNHDDDEEEEKETYHEQEDTTQESTKKAPTMTTTSGTSTAKKINSSSSSSSPSSLLSTKRQDDELLLFSVNPVVEEDLLLTRQIFPKLMQLVRDEIEQRLGANRITLRLRRTGASGGGGGGTASSSSESRMTNKYSRTETSKFLEIDEGAEEEEEKKKKDDTKKDKGLYEKAVTFVLVPLEVSFS